MKTELSTRFSEITDAQHAFMLLRKVHQKPGETVQVYAERLLALAADAFDNQQGQPVQRQLVDIFVDGLKEDQLKLKVFRENPNTLDAAITTATNEQNCGDVLICVHTISIFLMTKRWKSITIGRRNGVINVTK